MVVVLKFIENMGTINKGYCEILVNSRTGLGLTRCVLTAITVYKNVYKNINKLKIVGSRLMKL